MKKVLFVTGSLRRGGAERVLSILANEMAEKGWQVHILTLLFSKRGYQLNTNVEVIDISKEERNQMLDAPRLILQTRKIIKQLKPDAVISFMVTINIVTWLATRFLGVVFIPSERNDPSVGRGKVISFLQNLVYKQSTKTVMQTERAKNYFERKVQDNSIIIPNPIVVHNMAASVKECRIVSVGRLEPQKNRELLIEAFNEVHKRYPEYVLEIFGEGSLETKLQKQINDKELGEFVKLCGNVQNIHERIANAEVFVLSSDYEGLSNALLEALMMGLPCITTNCAGSEDAIENGKNGIIVPVGDKEALVSAMCALIEDKDMAMRLGMEAVKRSAKFSKDTIVNQWMELVCHYSKSN